MNYQLTHLQLLEAEAIHIIREVAAELQNPVILYSGGKDSACLILNQAKSTDHFLAKS